MHSLIFLWNVPFLQGIMKIRSPLLISRARMIGVLAAAIIMSILLAAANVTVTIAQQRQVITSKIEKVWETPAQFKTPESVIYEPNENVLFVSNIDGQPDSKDNQGFISKVSPLNGSIIELNWVTGLNAPKGMAITNNTNNTLLYVSDITDLVAIDIKSGKIINRYSAPGSAFLNDVASDNQGHIYVSDTVTNTIYRLDTNNNLGNSSNNNNNNTSLQVWLQSPELNGPNGLYVDNSNNKLIVVSFGAFSNPGGSIKIVDLQNHTISSLGKEGTAVPIGGLDGIEADTTGRHYYVTDNAAGKLYVVNSNGTGYETLDLQNQGAADLGVVLDQNVIVIPMMQDNKLEAYRITG
jgi:sugar lactone lactonase YvrE